MPLARAVPWVLLALLSPGALGPGAAALPWDDEAVRALERHAAERLALPLGEAVSLGGAVRGALDPPPGPAGTGEPLAPAGAGPAPPSAAHRGAFVEALAWVLAAGGAAAGAALGWRHVHARNVLEHARRADMLRRVRDRPGLHLRALARATGQPVQQAAYHLRVLERMGLVGSQMLAGRRCYHAAGTAPEVRHALAQAALVPGDQARRVLRFVTEHPGASQSEVARELGMLPGSARWHLQRLTERGALVEARAGRALTYRAVGAVSSGPRP